MNDYSKIIKENINHVITETNLFPNKYVGKVRDIYNLNDKLVLVTTDRLSAFDRNIAAIPFKGKVLNLLSAWWFKQTSPIIKNHVLSVPDDNITIAKKCSVFPVEFVVRGYLTGSTNTSIWTTYKNGERKYCGHSLPNGLKKNEPLQTPLLTPSTKDAIHDRPVSLNEIIELNLMNKKHLEIASQIALTLFDFGSRVAAKNGVILVDTKYEFGLDENGDVILIDEIHTPDSSRYWLATTYEERLSNNQEPDNFDKETLRLWYRENCDPYKDEHLPIAPDELIAQISNRYIQIFELITGETFSFGKIENNFEKRMMDNIINYI